MVCGERLVSLVVSSGVAVVFIGKFWQSPAGFLMDIRSFICHLVVVDLFGHRT